MAWEAKPELAVAALQHGDFASTAAFVSQHRHKLQAEQARRRSEASDAVQRAADTNRPVTKEA